MSTLPTETSLAVHGLSATIDGDWPAVVEALRRDFAWYATPPAVEPDLVVHIARREPEPDRFGALRASMVTERNVVYHDGDRTIVDYLGAALSVLSRSGRELHVEGRDGWIVRKAAFDFLVSTIGAHLDRIGLSRVHGLGLAGPAGGALVMLPMGGGKTTLALRALAGNGVGLLSEGSPLLDRHGRLHPFPLPLLVRSTSPEAADLPAEHVRRLEGIDPDPLTLEVAAFADHVPREPAPLRHVVLGERSLARASALEQLPRRAAVAPLLRESVVGFGFFQGMEFLVRGGPGGLARRLGPMRGRALRCGTALRQADVWRLSLGRDKDANWDALSALLV